MLFPTNSSGKSRKKLILFLSAIAILAAFLICIFVNPYFLDFFTNMIYLKYLPELESNTTIFVLLLFGLLTSFHCVSMCGGIMLTQTIKQKNEENGTAYKNIFLPTALYNAGRVLSYTLIGAIVGGMGQVLSLSNFLKGLIPIIGGLFMLVMAINLIGIFPVLRYIQIGLPKRLVKKLWSNSDKSPFFVGLLTGLMPCGPMQIVQLYALGTRSFFLGATSMFIFSIGTVPGLFTFGTLSTLITIKASKIIQRFSAVIVAFLGIVMVCRGLSLEGIAFPQLFSGSTASKDYNVSVLHGKVQTVTTTIGEDYFPPIEVKKGIKVVWTIKVPENVYNDCNDAIEIPMYHIEKKLKIGNNLVEFTPDKTGEFGYTCWMGMIKSRIKVDVEFP